MKFIIVAGGVLSGLGKGIVSSSIGLLLKTRGFKVTSVKIDPYVSVDAGTMRPAEHGEVFVTHDGGEIDQDVGSYERFLDLNLSKDNNITTGKIFQSVIDKERHFYYKGRDAEVIPDVINEIKDRIYKVSKGFDIVIVEVGGTTGDLENMPFLHAAREIGRENPSVYVMVTFLPFLHNVGELKSKPTQHAVARLREIGIMPDFIVTRNEVPIDQPRIETIAKRCFVKPENIFDDPDLDCIHELPLMFEEKKFAEKILSELDIKDHSKKDLKEWRKFVGVIKNAKKSVNIALVGKYVTHGASSHKDVYVSVLEALNHAGYANNVKVNVTAIDAERVETEKNLKKMFKNIQGIVAPQGWGSRGSEGKILAIKYARENKIPYLGLCYGMQMATVEFARHVLGFKKANSQEIDPKTPDPVIHIMEEQKKYLKMQLYGATIRLGAWPCVIKEGTKLRELYEKHSKPHSAWFEPNKDLKKAYRKPKGAFLIHERHRHRYEFNNKYKTKFEAKGMIFSGLSPDGKLVEAVELKDHPFFIGTQFHPEYLSRPLSPHPIFIGFIEAAIKNKKK